jgi:hypothetical protein
MSGSHSIGAIAAMAVTLSLNAPANPSSADRD